MTDRFKRPGSMSDADRALTASRRRAADRVAGIPEDFDEEDSMPIIIGDHDDEDPTPVERMAAPGSPPRRRRKRLTIQRFAEEIKGDIRELRKSYEQLCKDDANGILEVSSKLATLEERINAIADLGDNIDALRSINLQVAELRVSLFGLDGTNGKMGNLRADVEKAMERADAAPKFVKRALIWAGGGILGSLIPAVIFVKSAADDASKAKADAASERATIRAEIEAEKQDRAFLHAQVDSMLRMVRMAHGASITPGEPSP